MFTMSFFFNFDEFLLQTRQNCVFLNAIHFHMTLIVNLANVDLYFG
jgi:hypothetical protein